MSKQVCTGATLQCSFGTSPSSFTASGSQVSTTTAAGVVSDIGPSNIAPFGLCTSVSNPQVASATAAAMGVLTPMPCLPVISAPWAPGSIRVKIGSVAALDSSSQCMCTWGGVVTASDAGETAVGVV
jgi:hypothetical protein